MFAVKAGGEDAFRMRPIVEGIKIVATGETVHAGKRERRNLVISSSSEWISHVLTIRV